MGKKQSRLRPEEVEELVKATHCEFLSRCLYTGFKLESRPPLPPTVTPKELNRW